MNQKRKRGDVREDGKVFWGTRNGLDYWVKTERFRSLKLYQRKAVAEWRKSNPERQRELAQKSDAAFRARNPEVLRIRNKEWHARNREAVRQRNAAWQKANSAKISFRVNQRRAKLVRSTPADCWNEAVSSFYSISQRVSKCLGIPHSVDHIIPLAAGGSNCHRNLQILPARINSAKGARTNFALPDCYRIDGFRRSGGVLTG
jgi:5-methylcytosine-specific restriction endonuclease McrA